MISKLIRILDKSGQVQLIRDSKKGAISDTGKLRHQANLWMNRDNELGPYEEIVTFHLFGVISELLSCHLLIHGVSHPNQMLFGRFQFNLFNPPDRMNGKTVQQSHDESLYDHFKGLTSASFP